MTERDFESRLDIALKQMAIDTPVENPSGSEPETAELIRVAQHLQILAPAPTPQLADGRRRFLNEAARQLDQSGNISNWFGRVAHRPALAFAMILVLLVFAASAMMVFSQTNPALPMTWTQTAEPTLTATPTKTSLSPDGTSAVDQYPSISSRDPHLPSPQPVPAPVISVIKPTSFND